MFVAINDHNLHIALHGNEADPAIVLLHSLGTCADVWEKQVREFSRSHFVICPEFRGHGLSEVSRTPVTIEALTDDIVALLTLLELRSFHLVGISIGGLVAQLVAGRLSDTVQSLLILNSNIVSLAPQLWRERAAKVRADGLASIAEGILARWMTPASRKTAEGRGLVSMLDRTSPEGYAAGCDALAVADCRESAPRLTMPVTVAVGELDEATPPSASRALADAIPGASFHLITGAAHIPLFEQAEAVNRLIREAISHHEEPVQKRTAES
ncbi:3-oxoadipate enol-lactonase 2 [Ensifer psoraleae]|uniref:alpha/beta fold hydrolase n=1 Tax=Sinorhizobium psoraleae TaxID=520838 RepID=UPI00156A1891|nr:alpha/beta fold hydrolase [Sinorhizobium psoraleae]NRP76022.1 3-oxoadipate enol-lactonase 2 [Sinorhizobium psoraleae]